ncbi:high-affinity lysophosphatidic acid receptor-like [Colossoma macropomum]|uniref:high-affinity lysophosphatidic acid receptor-like n=1 Tax=Colossoma macropomum TaxID=42526 RepID=UPI001863F961|nr:high-affinity lysophosphatidic acid receptor-like [Colossoma macropomum]
MICNSSSGCGLPERHMIKYVMNVTELPGASNAPLPITLRAALSVVMVVIIIVGFLGNAVVCLIVYQKPAMRSAINLLLATLAFTDIMLSLFCMPVTAVTVVSDDWRFGLDFCRITVMLYWLFVLEGVAILLIISVDRFLIIVRRQDKLTPSRARLLIAGSWLLSFCLALPSVGSWPSLGPKPQRCILGYIESLPDRGYTVLLAATVFFIPVSVMLFSYLRILNAVRRNALRIHNHACPGPDQGGKAGLAVLRRPPQLSVDMSFKTRAFTTILILFVGFSVCWLPHTVLGLLAAFSQRFYLSAGFYPASVGALWLSYLKAVFNPAVYCWRIRKFREACEEFVPRSCRLPRIPGRSRRRVRPCSIYVCAESQSAM